MRESWRDRIGGILLAYQSVRPWGRVQRTKRSGRTDQGTGTTDHGDAGQGDGCVDRAFNVPVPLIRGLDPYRAYVGTFIETLREPK